MVQLAYLLSHLLKHTRANLFVINFIPTITTSLTRGWFNYIFLPPYLLMPFAINENRLAQSCNKLQKLIFSEIGTAEHIS